jgi:hypothetical protein
MTAALDLEPNDVAERLRQAPHAIPDAHRKPAAGGIPEQPGAYAWWVSPGSIPGIKGPAHPAESFELLYVGIAPKDEKSKATLRSRIRGQHLGGNIGSSTFRQSLAALLVESEGWVTSRSGSRSQLMPEHNRALSEWQQDHLRLAWVERPRPWEVEARVIALMQPPLNLADNASHPLYARLKMLRAKLRASSPIGDTAGSGRLQRVGSPEKKPPHRSRPPRVSTRDSVATTPDRRTQRVTAKDIEAGQVRIPRGATKTVFPRERRDIAMRLRGQELTCRWDPRYGPPERSGVIRVGKAAAADLLHRNDVLNVRVSGGCVELD